MPADPFPISGLVTPHSMETQIKLISPPVNHQNVEKYVAEKKVQLFLRDTSKGMFSSHQICIPKFICVT